MFDEKYQHDHDILLLLPSLPFLLIVHGCIIIIFFFPPQRFKKFLEFIRTEILLSFNLILNFQNHKHLISYPQTFFFNYTFAFVHTPTANIKCLANIVRIHVNSYQPQNNYNLETWQCNFVVTLKLKEKNVLIAHHQLVIA